MYQCSVFLTKVLWNTGLHTPNGLMNTWILRTATKHSTWKQEMMTNGTFLPVWNSMNFSVSITIQIVIWLMKFSQTWEKTWFFHYACVVKKWAHTFLFHTFGWALGEHRHLFTLTLTKIFCASFVDTKLSLWCLQFIQLIFIRMRRGCWVCQISTLKLLI